MDQGSHQFAEIPFVKIFVVGIVFCSALNHGIAQYPQSINLHFDHIPCLQIDRRLARETDARRRACSQRSRSL